MVAGRRSRMDDISRQMRAQLERETPGLHIVSYDRLVDKIKLLTNDVTLFRVREPNLPQLNSTSIDITMGSYHERDLEKAIVELLSQLESSSNLAHEVDIDIAQHRSNILNLIRFVQVSSTLSLAFPSLTAEWHPIKNGKITPSHMKPFSHYIVWWLGECGHEWQESVSNRTNLGYGCPICSNHQVLIGFNDFATLFPEIASEWHPTKNPDILPQDFVPGSPKRVWWLGECGHEWEAPIRDRTKHNSGCPYCAGVRVLPGFNDLATTNSALAKEWHPAKNGSFMPTDVMCGTPRKVWWLCKEGHEWQAVISSRNSGIGCPICSNHQVLSGYNDLATTKPELAAQWHPVKNGDLTPANFTQGSNKKVWWRCEKGHEWQATIGARTKGFGCPVCSGRTAWPGYNDLATLNPKLAAQWHPTKNGDLTPSQVTTGTAQKVWWQCEKGHEWQAQIASRHRGGHGCLICYRNRRSSRPKHD